MSADALERVRGGLGLALLLAALAVTGFGEWRAAGVARALAASGGPVVEVHGPEDLAGQDGRLVYMQGTPQIDFPARDLQFGVEEPTPRLTRRVEMHQWREIRDLQGGVTYTRNWHDHPIDSSAFRRTARHENPPFPFAGASFRGGTVSLHGVSLDPAIVAEFTTEEAVLPQFSSLPANLAASFRLTDGALWSNLHPGSPRVGDLKVSWTRLALAPVTVVGRLHLRMLGPSRDLPAPGFIVLPGKVSLLGMLPGRPLPPRLTWLWRLLGLGAGLAGGWLLLGRRPDALAGLAAGMLPVAALGGLLWIGAGWLRPALWGLLAAAALGVLLWRRRAA